MPGPCWAFSMRYCLPCQYSCTTVISRILQVRLRLREMKCIPAVIKIVGGELWNSNRGTFEPKAMVSFC